MRIWKGFKIMSAVALALILAVILWFSYDYLKYKTYEININEPVSGLSVDTKVHYNGVVVGHVRRIVFDQNDPRKIKILTAINKQTPITQGTQAIVGNYDYINLADDGSDLASIETQPDHYYPMIPVMKPPVDSEEKQEVDKAKIIAKLKSTPIEEISESLKKTNQLFETLITTDNADSIKQILYSLQQVSGVLAANTEKLNTLLVNSEIASKEFQPFLSAGKQAVQMLRTQTLPETHQLITDLNDTLAVVRELALTVKENPTILIRGASKPRLGPGEQLHYSKTHNSKVHQ